MIEFRVSGKAVIASQLRNSPEELAIASTRRRLEDHLLKSTLSVALAETLKNLVQNQQRTSHLMYVFESLNLLQRGLPSSASSVTGSLKKTAKSMIDVSCSEKAGGA